MLKRDNFLSPVREAAAPNLDSVLRGGRRES